MIGKTPVVTSLAVLLALCLGAGSSAIGQTASTGTILGTVKDQSDAVVPSAAVTLTSTSLGLRQQATSNSEGGYKFVQLQPGTYEITATAPGFQQTIVSVKVNVAESALTDIKLSIGSESQRIEVNSNAAQVSLQTTNTSIGDVIQHEEVAALPTVQRQITQLAYLQPGTTPMIGGGEGSSGGGTIAGGRTDQNNMTLDGIDITDKSEGGYLVPGQIASFPLPVDAIQEFRGTVSNPGTDQNRSGGGAFALTIRRGSNDWHGLVYDYYQNAALNANTWTANYNGNKRAALISNRFGTTVGGPIWKNKTFVFVAYEGYRFPRSTSGTRTGITQSLRNGQLTFQDQSNGASAAGTYRAYNFNTAVGPIAARCGITGNLVCDPRGLGFNPLVSQYFNFYPVANDSSTGDGVNTAGIRGNVRIPQNSDFLVGRLDHNISQNWRAFAYYLWEQSNQGTVDQLDFNPQRTAGVPLISTSTMPITPRVVVSGVTGSITPNLVYDLRFGYNSQGFNWKRETPQTLLPAAGYALQLGYSPSVSLFDQPGNSTVSTLPREAALTNEFQLNNSLSWVRGTHLYNVGMTYQHVNMYHYRLTQGGSIAAPVAQITSYYDSVPAANRPPTCVGTMSNCIRASDLTTYNQLYGMLLGQWDYTTFFNSRDQNGGVQDSLAHPPSYDQVTHHFEWMASDVWQMNPSLTLNYGLTFTYDTPHRDVDGKDYLLVDDSNNLIDPYKLLQQKYAAASKGAVYNQRIAYVHPQQLNGRPIYPGFFTLNPRAGAAWNPSFRGGLLGHTFGDHVTVLRGGYAMVHDQILGIQTELYGIIGNQLIATTNILTSPTCDAGGTPGPGCVSGSTPFRIGVDGKAFTGTPVPFSIPYFPREANALTGAAFGVGNGYGLDPNFHPGYYHSFNFTVQRQVPGGALIEAGWIGRYGRDLASSANVNAPPINLTDMSGSSSQTFAQAYDAIATALRGGGTVTAQPWFENVFGVGSTATFAAAQASNILQNNVSSVFTAWIDPQLQRLGRPTVLNRQFQVLTFQTSNGYLNYNAGFVSFRKRSSHGFSAVVNYTFAKCLDTNGRQGDSLNGRLDNPYNPAYAYGACQSDVRHVLQSYGRYEVPSPTAGLLHHVLGGWSTAYILTGNTGTVLEVVQGNTTGYTSSNTQGPTAALVAGATRPQVSRHNLSRDSTGKINYNLFSDPTAARNSFRYLTLSGDTFRSNRGLLYGLGQWNLDLNVARAFSVGERVKATLTFDFFNILNHPNLFTPVLNLNTTASTFGRITQDTAGAGWDNIGAGARRVQSSLRITF